MNKWETLSTYDYLKEKTRDIVHCHPINGVSQLKNNITLIEILREGWEPCSLAVIEGVMVQLFKRRIE